MRADFMPRIRANHDCVDTGNDFAIVGGAAKVPFPCDCLGRDYYNVKKYWDSATSKIKDSTVNAGMEVEFNFTLNGPQGAYVDIDIEVDHPIYGIIPISIVSFYLTKNNMNAPFTFRKYLYNGSDSDAHLHGFDVSISSDSTVTLKNRSVLIWQ
jgi:hypothetical protein